MNLGGAKSLEQVLAQMNALNRSLEGIIEVSQSRYPSHRGFSSPDTSSLTDDVEDGMVGLTSRPDWKRILLRRSTLEPVRECDGSRGRERTDAGTGRWRWGAWRRGELS